MAAPIRSRVLPKCSWKNKDIAASAVLMTFRRLMSIRRRISGVLGDATVIGQQLEIKGWVNGIRSHKDLTFLHVTDGSCITPLQVLANPEHTENVTYGSSVEVEGRLQASPAPGQAVELMADSVRLIGPCDTKEFPLKTRERHSVDYTRGFPHLRHRSRLFGALLRARNSATMAIHQYYQRNGYCLVNTPVITSNDAEGAGEVFTVQPANPSVPSPQSDDDISGDPSTAQFFGHPAFLSVSGQLHLEAVSGGFSKVYTFGPTFRAENSRGRHHLCEFYMIEAELAFTETLGDILMEMESLVKGTMSQVLADSPQDVAYFHERVAPGQRDVVDRILSNEFQRLSYKDAVQILEKQNDKFQFKISWGCDLHKEHEHYLVSYCNDSPVFITDFPVHLKPFYARLNDDGETVAAVDLLFPGVGELVGGSLREERYHLLKDRLDRANIAEDFDWYLDVRRFGSVPHGGYGMGFERYLQSLLGIKNIKDTIPYPRWSSNCKM